jgi:hypothetical protein
MSLARPRIAALTLAIVSILFPLASRVSAQSSEVLIQGTVTDRTSGAPIQGVGVSAGGPSVLTDVNGNYSLTGIQVTTLTGSVNFAPVAGYFIPPSQSYNLNQGIPATNNATLLSGGTVIQGVATDSNTQVGISGASVEVITTAGGGAAQTASDGSYSLNASNFEEAALNGFTITRIFASAPGYFSIQNSTNTAITPPLPAIQNVQLTPSSGTGIQGTVTDRTTGAPIQGVNVSAGGASALTDVNGNYSLAAAQVGEFGLSGSVNFSVTGYFIPPSQTYDLSQGFPITINATLLSGGTVIQGVVTDSNTQAGISGASIDVSTNEGSGGAQTGSGGSYSLGASNFEEPVLNGFTITRILASAPGYFSINNSGLSTQVNPPLPATQNVQLVPNGVSYAFTVMTVPSGLNITIDGTTYPAPQTFTWPAGSVHTLAVNTPQGSAGTQYVFNSWSDGGALSHTITAPAANGSYAASFSTQYLLTTNANPAADGTVTAGGWFNSGTSVVVTAAPNTGYQFTGFLGNLTGTTNPQTIVMNAPENVTATFSIAGTAPTITSANSATFRVGVAESFMVTTTGSPTPTLSESGALPSGVMFNAATGMLSGTAGATGTYHVSFTASNGVGSNAVQSFTLTVIGKLAKFSTTTMLASTPNPSILGEGIVLTAIVSSSGGIPPDGELITFDKGATPLGTAPLSGGTASITVSSLLVGTSVIVAHYSGDTSYSTSSSISVKQVVDKYATTVQLGSNLNPAAYGQSIIFTAAVGSTGANTPTGTVTFKNGTTILKTVSLVAGVASLTSADFAAGTLSLIAVYNSDAASAGSTSPTLFQVINQATTTTMVVSSLNPSNHGKSVKFTVTVESPTVTPTGTVTLTAGTTVLSTVKLAGGKASFATTTLPPGSVTMTAAYNGTANIEGSSGTTVQEVD